MSLHKHNILLLAFLLSSKRCRVSCHEIVRNRSGAEAPAHPSNIILFPVTVN